MRQDTLRLHRTDGSEELLPIPLKTTEGSAASVAQMAWGLRFCGQSTPHPTAQLPALTSSKRPWMPSCCEQGTPSPLDQGVEAAAFVWQWKRSTGTDPPAGPDCTVPLAQCDLQLALLQPAPSPVW